MRHKEEDRNADLKEVLALSYGRRGIVVCILFCFFWERGVDGGRARDVQAYVAKNDRLRGASGGTAERGRQGGRRDGMVGISAVVSLGIRERPER